MSEVHSNNGEVSNTKKTSQDKHAIDPNKRIDTSKKSDEFQNSNVDPNKRVSEVSDSKPSQNELGEVDPNKRVGENKTSDNQNDNSENKDSYPSNSIVYVDGKKSKTDDNGKIYSENGNLKPNCEYILNGFKYKTDANGRIINAQGDVKLPIGKRDNSGMIMNSKDKLSTDHKGHVIGHQLGGVESEGNLVPQDGELNNTEYRKLENYLAKLKADGHDVKIDVKLCYKGDSDRPDSFRVKYTVDGKTYVKTFKNESPQNGGN